jgi:chemotaxis protein methyltransferase CheR
LPHLVAKAKGAPSRLRIWSAGSSSGEEAYSAAMIMLAGLPNADRWDARILATDIDSSMVAHGTAGLYDAERADRIPDGLRRRFVEPVAGQPNKVRMAAALRGVVAFKRLNLLGRWPMSGPFDVIFCRNVAIYFDKPTQERLYSRLGDMLTEDGVLYIGHAENLMTAGARFQAHGKTIYSKRSS